jgi:hypothetical protein
VNQITGAIRLSDDQQRAGFTAQLTAAWQVVQTDKKRTAKQEALIRDIAEQNRAAAAARQKQLAEEEAARTAALAQMQAEAERARLHSEQLQLQTAHRAAAAAVAAQQQQQQAAAAQAMLYQQQQQQQQGQQRQPTLQQLRELLPRMEAKVVELRGQRAAAAAAGDVGAVDVVEGLLQNAERAHRKAVQMATSMQGREASGAMTGAGIGTDSVVSSSSDAQQQLQYPPLTEQGAQSLKQRASELQSVVAAGGPQVSCHNNTLTLTSSSVYHFDSMQSGHKHYCTHP